MTNDQDTDMLEAGDLDGDPGFEDFEGGKQSFSEALKTNPALKIGVVLGAMAIIIGGIVLFGGGSKQQLAPSTVAPSADLKETPGMTQVSPEYEEALKEVNEQTVQKALLEGSSAIPVPIGPSRGRVEIQANPAAEDPLERWRRVQEERLKKEEAAPVVQPLNNQPKVDPNAQVRQAMSESMAGQMESILNSLAPKGPKIMSVTDADYAKIKREEEAAAQQSAMGTSAAQEAANAAAEVEVLQEAGQIEYAQLLVEANTDSPGPVLAELASGPLAGSRLIGTFTSNDDFLILSFNSVIVDGVAIQTEAVAIDPSTSKPGMVTEIDRKYFQRVILPAAAAFIKGMGGAIAESGTTSVSAGAGTTTSSTADLDTKQEFFKGVEKAAQKLGNVLDEQDVKPMLRLAAGTHIGVLFTKAVEKRTGVVPPPNGSNPVTPQLMQQAQPMLFQLQQAQPAMMGGMGMPTTTTP